MKVVFSIGDTPIECPRTINQRPFHCWNISQPNCRSLDVSQARLAKVTWCFLRFLTGRTANFCGFHISAEITSPVSRRLSRLRAVGVQIGDNHRAICLQIAFGDGMTDVAGGSVMRATLPSRFITSALPWCRGNSSISSDDTRASWMASLIIATVPDFYPDGDKRSS